MDQKIEFEDPANPFKGLRHWVAKTRKSEFVAKTKFLLRGTPNTSAGQHNLMENRHFIMTDNMIF